MHQLTKNRLEWLDTYGEQVQSIMHDTTLTRRERVQLMNEKHIPTMRGQIGKWTLANVDQIKKRYFRNNN